MNVASCLEILNIYSVYCKSHLNSTFLFFPLFFRFLWMMEWIIKDTRGSSWTQNVNNTEYWWAYLSFTYSKAIKVSVEISISLVSKTIAWIFSISWILGEKNSICCCPPPPPAFALPSSSSFFFVKKRREEIALQEKKYIYFENVVLSVLVQTSWKWIQ